VCELAGIPGVVGEYTFTIQLTDGIGVTSTKTVSTSIGPAPGGAVAWRPGVRYVSWNDDKSIAVLRPNTVPAGTQQTVQYVIRTSPKEYEDGEDWNWVDITELTDKKGNPILDGDGRILKGYVFTSYFDEFGVEQPLQPDTTYYIFVRLKASINYELGEICATPLEVATEADPWILYWIIIGCSIGAFVLILGVTIRAIFVIRAKKREKREWAEAAEKRAELEAIEKAKEEERNKRPFYRY